MRLEGILDAQEQSPIVCVLIYFIIFEHIICRSTVRRAIQNVGRI